MFEYIKQPYVSPVDGVTNTRTGWKLTTDPEGLVIVEELPLAIATRNRLTSDILVPAGTTIYVWYKMELSNGEVKEYVGPIPFISREDNITSDLKPITRVDTPSVLWDDNNLYSGYNNLNMISSDFSGDALDGHLASTWVFKTPDDKIIHSSIFDLTNKNQITLNRSGFGIDRYDYIKAYIKHHSANGSTSDFGMTIIPTSIYPFKYVGNTVLDSKLNYTFMVNPYNVLIPNLSEVRVVSVKDNSTKIVYTDVSTLSFTIPAYTLDSDSSYYVQCFVADTQNGKYPMKLDITINTKASGTAIIYNNLLEYTLSDIVVESDTSVDVAYDVRDRLINNKLISYDNTSNLFNYHILSNTSELDTTVVPHNFSINDLIISDYKMFNLTNGRLLLVSRISTIIKVTLLNTVGGVLTIDSTFTPIEIIVVNTNHNLLNTVTLSEDEKYIYLVSIKTDHIELGSINLYNGIYDVLDNRPELTKVSYNPTKMVLQTIGDKKLISFGGSGDLWHYYNINDRQWLAMGKLPDELISDTTTPYRVMLLGDRSVLLCSDFNTPKKLIRFKPNMSIEKLDLNISLRNYNIFTIDTSGVLYGYSDSLNSRIKLKPTKII